MYLYNYTSGEGTVYDIIGNLLWETSFYGLYKE